LPKDVGLEIEAIAVRK